MKTVINNQYQSKQAIIKALCILNVPLELAEDKNVLENINLYNEILDYCSIDITDNLVRFEKKLEYLQHEFEKTVNEFVEYLKGKIIVETDSSQKTLYILEDKLENDSPIHTRKELYSNFIKIAKINSRLSFGITRITKATQTNDTTVEYSRYDISIKNKRNASIFGMRTQNRYDDCNQMISSETGYYNLEDGDINQLENVCVTLYNYKNRIEYIPKNKTCTFTHVNMEYEGANIKIKNLQEKDDKLQITEEELNKIINDSEENEETISWFLEQVEYWRYKTKTGIVIYEISKEALQEVNLCPPLHVRLIKKLDRRTQ